jgi:hypothetical protein
VQGALKRHANKPLIRDTNTLRLISYRFKKLRRQAQINRFVLCAAGRTASPLSLILHLNDRLSLQKTR